MAKKKTLDIARELLSSPAAVSYLNRVAAEVLVNTRDSSPVRTGALRRSYQMKEATVNPETGYAEAAVYSTSSLWHLFEFGSANSSPSRPFYFGATKTPNVKWEGN